MANISDFLEGLAPGSYTDEQLRTSAAEFGLNEEQVDAVVSRDLKKIRSQIKDDTGEDPTGKALRVVM